jgi:tetratricopeptide (TPR) repeat protein
MNDQDNLKRGLVPTGLRNLVPSAAANPLVARGLADLAQSHTFKLKDSVPTDQPDADEFIRRGVHSADLDEAMKNFDEGLRLAPSDPWNYIIRGWLWSRQKEYDKAIQDFDAAIRLDPRQNLCQYYAYVDRGRAWNGKRDYGKAIEDFDEAIRLWPESADRVRIDRGFSLWGQKEHDKAIEDFARAIQGYEEWIRNGPDNPDSYTGLAWLFATCPEQKVRNGRRAIELATRACELTEWKKYWQLNSLAAAYAEAGQFGEAVFYQTMALELLLRDEPFVKMWVNPGEFRERLKLYNQKKPYRDTPVSTPRRYF